MQLKAWIARRKRSEDYTIIACDGRLKRFAVRMDSRPLILEVSFAKSNMKSKDSSMPAVAVTETIESKAKIGEAQTPRDGIP